MHWQAQINLGWQVVLVVVDSAFATEFVAIIDADLVHLCEALQVEVVYDSAMGSVTVSRGYECDCGYDCGSKVAKGALFRGDSG